MPPLPHRNRRREQCPDGRSGWRRVSFVEEPTGQLGVRGVFGRRTLMAARGNVFTHGFVDDTHAAFAELF